MAHVGTFVEAVGQGCVRFGRLDRYIVGKLSGGSGSKGGDGLDDIMDTKLSCPAIVDNHDSPKVILELRHPGKMVLRPRVTSQLVL